MEFEQSLTLLNSFIPNIAITLENDDAYHSTRSFSIE